MKNWIEDEKVFSQIYERALGCPVIDSGRYSTSLKKLIFNDVDLLSNALPCLIQKLLEWSEDDGCEFVVLRPDPEYYFHRLFGKYPVIEIKRGMDVAEYLAALNEGPPESIADALGINYYEYVFVPRSFPFRWFIHALRSDRDDGGHLWVPAEWLDKIAVEYPYATPG